MATELPGMARAADEPTTLREMLDYYRVVMIRKAEGLTTAQATDRSTPTGLTLFTLIRHLTDVERGWFRDFADPEAPFLYCTDDDPDGDFHPGPGRHDRERPRRLPRRDRPLQRDHRRPLARRGGRPTAAAR